MARPGRHAASGGRSPRGPAAGQLAECREGWVQRAERISLPTGLQVLVWGTWSCAGGTSMLLVRLLLAHCPLDSAVVPECSCAADGEMVAPWALSSGPS